MSGDLGAPTAIHLPFFVSSGDIADATGVPVRTVWRWCRTEVIPATKVGARYLIPLSFLESMYRHTPGSTEGAS